MSLLTATCNPKPRSPKCRSWPLFGCVGGTSPASALMLSRNTALPWKGSDRLGRPPHLPRWGFREPSGREVLKTKTASMSCRPRTPRGAGCGNHLHGLFPCGSAPPRRCMIRLPGWHKKPSRGAGWVVPEVIGPHGRRSAHAWPQTYFSQFLLHVKYNMSSFRDNEIALRHLKDLPHPTPFGITFWCSHTLPQYRCHQEAADDGALDGSRGGRHLVIGESHAFLARRQVDCNARGSATPKLRPSTITLSPFSSSHIAYHISENCIQWNVLA